ncbi:universal stress protein [Chelatococcus sp. SYSU_G07232]|uniref:Universal stress protein n=1 Tax=Chelatococcus albus TaxID=3047466 RepID=A0ABT7ABD9_9HYPH|nr:universal stress protein [Chelatococcus sp. SYSU_G07232]MDJ1156689.1 universal stress protein [Chelatococcus sp. SYSU_G07232]
MIKDVMVHLDGTGADEVRIGHAERIALAFGAHVTGIYTNLIPNMAVPVDGGVSAAAIMADVEREVRERGDGAHGVLVRRLERLAVPNELRRFDVFPGELASAVATQARSADLFVALRPYSNDAGEHWPTVVEAALFGSGRGVYLAPDAPVPAVPIKRVLIAWNDGREAARAVAEAMPFLQAATRVVVAMVDEDGAPEENGREPGADIARHLDRHGVATELYHVPADGRRASEVLREEAQRLATDLVVMGGYGHSRLREWVLGGTTRDLLTTCSIPILMAH